MSDVQPSKQNVSGCLKDKKYEIGFYQREYVWIKETVEALLKDIVYVFDNSYEQVKNHDFTPELMGEFDWYYLNVFITNSIKGWERHILLMDSKDCQH